MRTGTRAKDHKIDTIEEMGCNSPLWAHRAPEGERRNVCALVIYIPDPLGRFLDDLRRELVPAYDPHAHVSVLPPRPMVMDWESVSDQARAITQSWKPFDVELTAVEKFPATDVVYLEVGAGSAELQKLHLAMNTGALAFDEPFSLPSTHHSGAGTAARRCRRGAGVGRAAMAGIPGEPVIPRG